MVEALWHALLLVLLSWRRHIWYSIGEVTSDKYYNDDDNLNDDIGI